MAKASDWSARAQRGLNVVMRAVLATPLLHRCVSNRVLVLDIRGRKTGRHYRIPVGYTPSGEALLIGTAGTWRRNLVPGQPIPVTVARRRQMMSAEAIDDEQRCTGLYRQILAHNPVHGRYAGIRTAPDGAPDSGDLRDALRRGIAVVRLTPSRRLEAPNGSEVTNSPRPEGGDAPPARDGTAARQAITPRRSTTGNHTRRSAHPWIRAAQQ